jgi:hypothetical protein
MPAKLSTIVKSQGFNPVLIILVGVCAFFLIRVFEFGIYAKVLVYNLRLIVRKITDEKNECCCSRHLLWEELP